MVLYIADSHCTIHNVFNLDAVDVLVSGEM
jgi:hypothetical protein